MNVAELKELTKANVLRKKQESEAADLTAAKIYLRGVKDDLDRQMVDTANRGENSIRINIPATALCSRDAFTKALIEAYPEGPNKDQFKVSYKEDRVYRLEDEWMEVSW